jgi:SAM-dependent methyltransferase
MLDWRGISTDPTNREATAKMDAFFRDITRVEAISRVEMIENFCRGQEVLDIGAGEHDIAFFSEEGWEHNRIKRVAKKAVAVEINPELCKHYNAKGFDFRCADATSDMDLGERFDRVFCGDVIEHVNDPVGLLNFAKRHLKSDGVMLFTTPNPFAPRFRQHRAQRGTRYVMANLEHTRWVSISNMHELAWRAGLEMKALRWPMLKRPKPGLAGKLAIVGKQAQLAFRPLEDVFHEYAFELAPSKR